MPAPALKLGHVDVFLNVNMFLKKCPCERLNHQAFSFRGPVDKMILNE